MRPPKDESLSSRADIVLLGRAHRGPLLLKTDFLMFGDIGVAVARQAATSRSDIHSRGLSYRVAQDIQALQHIQGD